MSFARVSSVLKGLGGSGITVGVGAVIGCFLYKKAIEDIVEVVKESKDIMCIPDTYVAQDEDGHVINEFLDADTSLTEEGDIPLEVIAKSEKYNRSAALVLRGSMMLIGLGLSVYVMAEKGAELYQFIESFDLGAAGQQVLAATVTGVTLTILPAAGVSAGKPVAELIEAGTNKLSCWVNYAKSIFKNGKESKKDDDVEFVDNMELIPFTRRRNSASGR